MRPTASVPETLLGAWVGREGGEQGGEAMGCTYKCEPSGIVRCLPRVQLFWLPLCLQGRKNWLWGRS